MAFVRSRMWKRKLPRDFSIGAGAGSLAVMVVAWLVALEVEGVIAEAVACAGADDLPANLLFKVAASIASKASFNRRESVSALKRAFISLGERMVMSTMCV